MAHPLPTRIEAEDYDNGGEGVAYHDTTAGNHDDVYRHDDVDISAFNGGYNIGYITAGEWLKYTVTSSTAKTYGASFRVASWANGRTITLKVDDVIMSTISVPNNGGNGWATVKTALAIPQGTHTIRLDFNGDCQNIDYFELSDPNPVAGFTANPTSGSAPLSVQFTDQSTGTPIGWQWDFQNDGIIDSNAKNPNWIYSAPGAYTVKLTVTNAYGSDTVTKYSTVTVNAPQVVAAFTASPTSGTAPMTVTFTDQSTGNPNRWQWDFGDGTTDTTKNPVKAFRSPGTYTVILTASNTYGSSDTETKIGYITVSALSTTGPYKPHNLPTRIEAEDYDNGGEGVAYHDTTPGNQGGTYRNDNVDIETGATGYDIGSVTDGEWLTYTVTVPTAGEYTGFFNVAGEREGRSITVSINNTPVGTAQVPNTGGSTVFVDVPMNLNLPAGTHVLKLTFTGDKQNIDYFDFPSGPHDTIPTPTLIQIPTPAAFGTSVIPGTILAADYNTGGEGIAYHDTTTGNQGGAYRSDDVDIEYSSDTDGPVVDYMRPGEWLAYAVNVTSEGIYDVTFTVSSATDGNSFTVTMDDTPIITVVVPNTGSFDTYTTVKMPVWVLAGKHEMKVMTNGYHNLGKMVFTQHSETTVTQTVTATTVTPNSHGGTNIPGTVLAENYDDGGEGVAYHDTTPGNQGGQYRSDDVDIEYSSTENTNVLSYVQPGEWVRYTVNVTSAGVYDVSFRVSTPKNGTSFMVLVNGMDACQVNIPNTGSFDQYTTQVQQISLPAGLNQIRINFNGYDNLEYLKFQFSGGATTQTPTISPVKVVPGGAGTPTSTKQNGKYYDVNGNGVPDFNDVVLYFNNMEWIAANEPIDGFDYNRNGQIDFNDVVWLFNNFDAPSGRIYNVTAVAIGPGTITPSGKISVTEGEDITFSMTHENAMPTPYSTQSGYLPGNLVLVDPAVTPTPFPTPGQGSPSTPSRSTFTPSYTLHDVRSDHTIYSCFYYSWLIC